MDNYIRCVIVMIVKVALTYSEFRLHSLQGLKWIFHFVTKVGETIRSNIVLGVCH